MLHWNPGPLLTCSSDWLALQVPCARFDLGKTAFSISAADSWNLLQHDLKLNTLILLGSFKILLNNHPLSACDCSILTGLLILAYFNFLIV